MGWKVKFRVVSGQCSLAMLFNRPSSFFVTFQNKENTHSIYIDTRITTLIGSQANEYNKDDNIIKSNILEGHTNEHKQI